LSHRSDAACDRPAGWGTATYRSHGVRLTDTAPRGYGTMTVSMFGGPRTPGAADQGELSAYDPVRHTSVTASTGPGTSDHTTTLPPVPVGKIAVYRDEYVPGLSGGFTTTGGAGYDAASFTVRYTFLTPQS
jgi:hypothetical protein